MSLFFNITAASKKLNISDSISYFLELIIPTEGQVYNTGDAISLSSKITEVGVAYPNYSLGVVSVSKHIRGHIASFSDNTDTYQVNAAAAELFGLRNNIGLLCFDYVSSQARKDAYSMGVIDFGYYDQGVTTPETVLPILTTIRQGRVPTALSYALGTDDNKILYLPKLLGGRNSSSEMNPLDIQYDNLTRTNLIARPSTMRFNYYSEMTAANFLEGTNAEGLIKLQDYIDQTIALGGWYTNFMHWHWWLKDYSKNYFQKLQEYTDGQDVFFGSYSDVLEHYFLKESVNSIDIDENNVIRVFHEKRYSNSPYENISTPLWIKVDLTGTSLVNKNISTSHRGRIRSMGSNIYYISVPLDYSKPYAQFRITETITSDYVNLNKPIISRIGNEITSDQPVKITLFSKLKTDAYELSAVINERQLTPATSFTLATTLDTVNRDYYLGFINYEKISGTLEF